MIIVSTSGKFKGISVRQRSKRVKHEVKFPTH